MIFQEDNNSLQYGHHVALKSHKMVHIIYKSFITRKNKAKKSPVDLVF